MKIINEPRHNQNGSVTEKAWETKEGYHGVALFNSMGFRNGYVGVPDDHILWLTGYGYIPMGNVHGGLTYTGHLERIFPEKDFWYIGFDCAHAYDICDEASLVKYNLAEAYHIPNTTLQDSKARTLEYVVEEVNNLSEQLTPQGLMKLKLQS